MKEHKKQNQPLSAADLGAARRKYFLQLVNVKSDTNMTRVYSVMAGSSFFNPPGAKK